MTTVRGKLWGRIFSAAKKVNFETKGKDGALPNMQVVIIPVVMEKTHEQRVEKSESGRKGGILSEASATLRNAQLGVQASIKFKGKGKK